jgi:hypothetical protein
MVASDLSITKGNRKTSLELGALGIPSISVSDGSNKADEVRVSRIPTNSHFQVGEIDAETLAAEILRKLAIAPEAQTTGTSAAGGLAFAALRIASHIDSVRKNADNDYSGDFVPIVRPN